MMCKSSTKMNYERLLVSYMYFKYVLGERVYSLSGGCSLPLLSPFPRFRRLLRGTPRVDLLGLCCHTYVFDVYCRLWLKRL